MHSTWTDMFVLAVPVAEKILRPLMVYAFLILGLRVAGKRELAQLNPFDLVVLLTLSNTVQNAIIGEDNSVTGGLIGAATLLIANYLVVRFLFAHEKLDRLVEGEPDALIENGVVREDRLRRELLTRNELETAAHRQGFSSLQEIERAVIEPGVQFSSLPGNRRRTRRSRRNCSTVSTQSRAASMNSRRGEAVCEDVARSEPRG